MKKAVILLLAAFASIAASAQITWNVKAGGGFSNYWGDAETSTHPVAKIGVGIEKPLSSNWSLMPSFELAWKGAKDNITVTNPYEEYNINFNLFYAQIPVLFAYRINLSENWNTTLKAGPYIAYAFHYNEKTNLPLNENLIPDVKRFDFGMDIGVDFECRRFVFGLEYEIGFLSIEEGYLVNNSAFYATVGWKF